MQTLRGLAAAIVLLFAALAATQAGATSFDGLSGVSLASTFQSGRTTAVAAVTKKWSRVLAGATGDTACPAAKKGCTAWQALKAQLNQAQERKTLLERVNRAMNRLEYFPDDQLWALHDYWATPAEFLARGAGDCEDYAIAKYFLLLELGIPAEAMRIAIVRDVARGLIHAVLLVQTEGGPMMLDNVIEEVVPAARVPQYRALLALNHTAMSVYIGTTAASAAGR